MSEISVLAAVFLALLALLLGLFAGFVTGLTYARNHLSVPSAANPGLAAEDALKLQSAFTGQVSGQLDTYLRPIYDSLHALSDKVGQVDLSQSEKLASLGAQLVSAQRVDQEILVATRGLDSALRNTSRRGAWGEASLRRVLELSGLTKHIDFSEQVSLATEADDSGAKPDVVVHLPNKAALIIDAKVPLDAYLQAGDLTNAEQLRAHATAVQRHVNVLAKREYPQKLFGAVDSTVLFMPSEALVSASLEADPTLFEKALAQGVIIVGPAGLLALLRSVGHLWARQSLAEDAQEILKLGSTLTARLNRLTSLLIDLGKNLTASVNSYNQLIGSFENRFRATVKSISTLESSISEGGEPVAVEVRRLVAD